MFDPKLYYINWKPRFSGNPDLREKGVLTDVSRESGFDCNCSRTPIQKYLMRFKGEPGFRNNFYKIFDNGYLKNKPLFKEFLGTEVSRKSSSDFA